MTRNLENITTKCNLYVLFDIDLNHSIINTYLGEKIKEIYRLILKSYLKYFSILGTIMVITDKVYFIF